MNDKRSICERCSQMFLQFLIFILCNFSSIFITLYFSLKLICFQKNKHGIGSLWCFVKWILGALSRISVLSNYKFIVGVFFLVSLTSAPLHIASAWIYWLVDRSRNPYNRMATLWILQSYNLLGNSLDEEQP